jgi:hypothetical protein
VKWEHFQIKEAGAPSPAALPLSNPEMSLGTKEGIIQWELEPLRGDKSSLDVAQGIKHEALSSNSSAARKTKFLLDIFKMCLTLGGKNEDVFLCSL